MWGILPMASSLLALFLVLLVPERRRVGRTIEFPVQVSNQTLLMREAK